MELNKKYPIPTEEQEDIQQALGVVWTEFEQGNKEKNGLRKKIEDWVRPGIYEILANRGLVQESGSDFELSNEGWIIAKNITRRHRLTERLLTDVLVLPKESIDPNACRMEHVIGEDVEEAICILLGHPAVCPHGLKVPKGKCCDPIISQTGPIVEVLSRFLSGQEGRVVYLLSQDRPELHKLMSMGLMPGVHIRVTQTSPAFVVLLGETMLALDPYLAQHIFVRRKNGHLQ